MQTNCLQINKEMGELFFNNFGVNTQFVWLHVTMVTEWGDQTNKRAHSTREGIHQTFVTK